MRTWGSPRLGTSRAKREPSAKQIGRGDDTVGSPHRARIFQFELFELKCLNSSFSSSNFSIRVFRAYPLIELRRTAPCRAIRGSSILVNSTPPPLKDALCGPSCSRSNPEACAQYPQLASQDVRPSGPKPWKILAHIVQQIFSITYQKKVPVRFGRFGSVSNSFLEN